MKLSVKLVCATVLALGATPALAFTYVPSSATPVGQQFADPDAALESTASTLRDDVVTNNLRAQGGPLAGAGSNFASPSRGGYGYGATLGPAHYFGGAPADFGSSTGGYEAPSMPFLDGPHR